MVTSHVDGSWTAAPGWTRTSTTPATPPGLHPPLALTATLAQVLLPLAPFSISPYLLVMGQASSRTRTPPPPRHDQTSPITVPAHDRSISSSSSAPSTPKSSRRSFRRSIRAFLSHPHPRLDGPSNSPSPSSRKRWRSSRRISSRRNPPSALSETSTNPAHSVPTPDDPDDVQLVQSSHPSGAPAQLSAYPSTNVIASPSLTSPLPSSPLSPDGQDGLAPPDISSHSGTPDRRTVFAGYTTDEVAINGSRLEGPDLVDGLTEVENSAEGIPVDEYAYKGFVQGSSRDGQVSPPLPSLPDASHSPVEPEPSPDSNQQLRHFQPPGPLVVVQGVVNTSDNPTAPPSAPLSRSSRSTSSSPQLVPSLTRPHSFAAPPSAATSEDRSHARSRLSAFLPRPTSMLGRRASTPDDSEPFRTGSSTNNNSNASTETTPHDGASSPSSNTDHGSNENDNRPRPLSPGSIDVLGTLLRCVHSCAPYRQLTRES